MRSELRIVEGDKKSSIFQDLEALRIPPGDDDLQDTRQPPSHTVKHRQFARYDETWRTAILAAGRSVRPATHRLVAVLLAEADFHLQIKVSAAISTAASLTPNEKRQALEQLEKLEQLRALENGHRIRVVASVSPSLEIDTAEDLDRARHSQLGRQ